MLWCECWCFECFGNCCPPGILNTKLSLEFTWDGERSRELIKDGWGEERTESEEDFNQAVMMILFSCVRSTTFTEIFRDCILVMEAVHCERHQCVCVRLSVWVYMHVRLSMSVCERASICVCVCTLTVLCCSSHRSSGRLFCPYCPSPGWYLRFPPPRCSFLASSLDFTRQKAKVYVLIGALAFLHKLIAADI